MGQAGYRKVLAQFNGDVSLTTFESILHDAAASSAVDQDQFILTELLDAVGGVGQCDAPVVGPTDDHAHVP